MAEDLLATLLDSHELTVETTEHDDPAAGGVALVAAISTCSCLRWGGRTVAPARDRQQLLEAIARVHRDHAVGADRGPVSW